MPSKTKPVVEKVVVPPEPWEIGTPLMQRTTCPTCKHMHRSILALKDAKGKPRCYCCEADWKQGGTA